MCRIIEVRVTPAGVLQVTPQDCQDAGTTCRALSQPFMALGRVVDDIDLGRSHVVAIEVEWRDKKAIDAAAERCGLIAVATDQFDWYGSWQNDYAAGDAAYQQGISPQNYGRCQWALVQATSPIGLAEKQARAEGRHLTPAEVEAIRVKNWGTDWRRATKPYSVGVVASATGAGFRPVFDAWQAGYGLMPLIGKAAAKLNQAYGAEAALRAGQQARHRLRSEMTLADGTIQVLFEVPERL